MVQIFESKGKTYKLIGTGFIVRKQGDLFLLTAAHVLPKDQRKYFVYSQKVFHQLSGDLYYPEITASKEGVDIAKLFPDFCFIKLSEVFVESALSEFIVFDESLLGQGPYSTNGIFLIAGYLISKTKFVLKTRVLDSFLFCHELSPAKVHELPYLVLPYLRKEGSKMPELNGLSCSPIFYVPPDSNAISIIGVATHYSKRKRRI
ncbi:hypothetical protein [Leptospira stimsonii]|uniref:Serine protease n=1 Tax=Leptospira stimsonii TaxID=2202203 RepID=A0ABY2N4S7_9LEPT|nr:hypothetical protein [Leptospira stimsonii]TGK12927.1 hypothetical protein EHO98_19280 [Leptospira stimsonii]TGM16914.1 hypothetical protein EHQ90_08415 [Leptospira stimsonii]